MNWLPDKVRQDKEYMSHISKLLRDEALLSMDEITHHKHTTRLRHSCYVSYTSYCVAKQLNCDAGEVARAGLLHDFFLENRDEIAEMQKGSHNGVHPKIALENAKELTTLSEREENIILSHMFLTTFDTALPKYKESFVVTVVDKYCAISEFFIPVKNFIGGLALKLKTATN